MPGVKNVEKATYAEDVLGEVKKGTKQPKVDFWIEIGSENKEDSVIIGIQWTISSSRKKLLEKEKNVGYAYKEKYPDAKIKADENERYTVIPIGIEKRLMIDIYNEYIGLEEEEKRSLVFAELSRSNIPGDFFRRLDPPQKEVIKAAVL